MTAKQGLRRPGLRGRRAPRPTGEDREAAILETFERLLGSRSFSAVSVDDLARGAGISRPSFYFYFPSKDAVLATLLDRVIAEADSACAEAAAAPATDYRARWRGAIEAYHRTFGAHWAVSAAAVEAAPTSPEIQALWSRGFEGWVRSTTATIEAERRRGAAPSGIPARDLAVALNAMNERVLRSTRNGETPAIAEEDVVDVLLAVWLSAIYGPVAAELTAEGLSTAG